MIQLSTSLLYIINKENTSTNIHSPLQTTIKMSLFATITSTFSNVHYKTGRWISQELLEIHTAITDGDFRKAGILIGERLKLTECVQTIQPFYCKYVKQFGKMRNAMQYLSSRCSWIKEPELILKTFMTKLQQIMLNGMVWSSSSWRSMLYVIKTYWVNIASKYNGIYK